SAGAGAEGRHAPAPRGGGSAPAQARHVELAREPVDDRHQRAAGLPGVPPGDRLPGAARALTRATRPRGPCSGGGPGLLFDATRRTDIPAAGPGPPLRATRAMGVAMAVVGKHLRTPVPARARPGRAGPLLIALLAVLALVA